MESVSCIGERRLRLRVYQTEDGTVSITSTTGHGETDKFLALLIVDEALKRILTGERSKYYIAQTKLPPAPYQGGYQDFLPFESLEDAQKTPGPGRVSIFDDLNHYLESHFSSLQLSEDAMSSTLFLQKIIASELTLVAQYFRSVLYQLGWLLTRRRTFKNFSTNWVEESWSDLNAYERRLDELRRGVDVILHFLQERIPPNPTHPRDWRDGVPDFTWLAAELDALTQRAAKLLDAFASLSSLVGTRESLREAGSASTLAFAGLIFVPLSLVASILSLPDPYSPHRSQFGMYWALALPITVAIVVGYCGVIWWKLLPPEWKSFSRKHTA